MKFYSIFLVQAEMSAEVSVTSCSKMDLKCKRCFVFMVDTFNSLQGRGNVESIVFVY